MRFFCKRYFDWLFTAGLLFSALISVNRQYGFLPDFLEGALTGLAIVFLLLPGTLRRSVAQPQRLKDIILNRSALADPFP